MDFLARTGILTGLFAIAGCATSYPRLSFAVEERILRETTLDEMPEGMAQAGDGVVRVMRFGGRGGSACSGALIGPRHVLTAQHCVVARDAQGEATTATLAAGGLHVELGGDYLPWGRVGVREVHPCDRDAADLEHDVAVLVLSKPVPPDVPIFDVSYGAPREAAVFALAGFGTDEEPRSAPELGMLLSVNRHVRRGPVLTATDARVVVDVYGAPGDSGGPIVDAEGGRIFAVVSRRGADEQAGAAGRHPMRVSGPRLSTCKKAIDAARAR